MTERRTPSNGDLVGEARRRISDFVAANRHAGRQRITSIRTLRLDDLDSLAQQLEQAKQRERQMMRRCLEAAKFDSQFRNSRLPGDSALSAVFASFEEILALTPDEEADFSGR